MAMGHTSEKGSGKSNGQHFAYCDGIGATAGRTSGKTTFLTNAEVESLVRDASEGDELAVQQLLTQFRPLIVRTAAKYSQIGFDEAVQEGYVAMLKAIHSFDASLGVPFVGYLTTKLRGDVRTAMRKLWRYNERVEYPSVSSGEDGRSESDLWDSYVGAAYRTGGYGGNGGYANGGFGGGFGTGGGSGAAGDGGLGPGGGAYTGAAAGGSDGCAGCESYEDVELNLLLEGVTLSPRERLAVAGILSGFSCSELAEIHGVGVETVKTWRKRALQKLRVALADEDWVRPN